MPAERPLTAGGVHEETQPGSPDPQQMAGCQPEMVAATEAEPEIQVCRLGQRRCPTEAAKGPRPLRTAPQSPPGPAAQQERKT